jgi:hypothetical protein
LEQPHSDGIGLAQNECEKSDREWAGSQDGRKATIVCDNQKDVLSCLPSSDPRIAVPGCAERLGEI